MTEFRHWEVVEKPLGNFGMLLQGGALGTPARKPEFKGFPPTTLQPCAACNELSCSPGLLLQLGNVLEERFGIFV